MAVTHLKVSAKADGGDATLVLPSDWNADHTTGTIDVENVDTTISRSAAGVIAVEGVVIPSISSTNTLTNKRLTNRAPVITQSATPAINTDITDVAHIVALAQAITSMTSSLTGTPVEGDELRIDITDNGTARAISWGLSFEASTVALPTTTVINARLDVELHWNVVTSKWRCVKASVAPAAADLTGTALPAAIVTSSLTTVGTLASPVFTSPALGTPASGTMTNVTGIPAAAILAGSFGAGAYVISTSLQAATIELGDATDTTLSRSAAGVLAVESVVIPSISSTNTLTNKRITPRVVTAADDATAIIDVDITDQYQLTAMANATTISTTGTPVAGQKLVIRLKDDATARALTWDAVFRAVGVTLPTTTVVSKTHYIGCLYNATDTKWDAVAVVAQA